MTLEIIPPDKTCYLTTDTPCVAFQWNESKLQYTYLNSTYFLFGLARDEIFWNALTIKTMFVIQRKIRKARNIIFNSPVERKQLLRRKLEGYEHLTLDQLFLVSIVRVNNI